MEIFNNNWFHTLLAVLAAGIGAYFGAYLKKRGEDRAMLENFKEIRKQLRATTRDTEEIKQQLQGSTWRTQQQWAAREQYYSQMLMHLHHCVIALDSLSNYYMEPGSEHILDSEQGKHFQMLLSENLNSLRETRKLLGPSAMYLSPIAIEALNKLLTDHFVLANFSAPCTADYVSAAQVLVKNAYDQVLQEAKQDLEVPASLT